MGSLGYVFSGGIHLSLLLYLKLIMMSNFQVLLFRRANINFISNRCVMFSEINVSQLIYFESLKLICDI